MNDTELKTMAKNFAESNPRMGCYGIGFIYAGIKYCRNIAITDIELQTFLNYLIGVKVPLDKIKLEMSIEDTYYKGIGYDTTTGKRTEEYIKQNHLENFY
jgi:hypothetical protein